MEALMTRLVQTERALMDTRQMPRSQPQRSCNRVLRSTGLGTAVHGKRIGNSEEHNNGLEAWRGLKATYDSNNKGRQRARMQCLLQPKRAESILQTTAAVERWDCDVGTIRQDVWQDVG